MSSLNCPKCIEPLVEVYREDVKTRSCGRCGGLWLNEGKIRGLVHRAVGGTPGRSAVGAALEIGDAIEAFLCPKCNKPTLEQGWMGALELAHCWKCEGIWLEHHGLITGERSEQENMARGLFWRLIAP